MSVGFFRPAYSQCVRDTIWSWSCYFGQPKFTDLFHLTNRFIIAVLLLTYTPINVKPAVGGGGAGHRAGF